MQNQIDLAQVWVLVTAAVAYSAKSEREVEMSPSLKAVLEESIQGSKKFSEYAAELQEENLLDEHLHPTPAGMKLVLNAKSFTPNFKRVAQEGGFSTAIAMFFRSAEAIQEMVAKSPSQQILPGKGEDGTKMLNTLIGVRDMINQITADYQQSQNEKQVAPKGKLVKVK